MASRIHWLCPTCLQPAVQSRNEQVHCAACATGLKRIDGIWDVAPGFTPPRFSADRREHLFEIEHSHFWFAPRSYLLEHRLAKLLPANGARIVELGCGSGQFLPVLRRLAAVRVGVEAHVRSLQRARDMDPDAYLLHGNIARIPLVAAQFDTVIALDVLEHVEPLPFLREANRLARPGGSLLLSVPAFQSLRSAADHAAGHRCRYRIDTVRPELHASGWQLLGYTHYQFFLFPVVFLSRLLHRHSQPKIERSPPKWLNQVLRTISFLEVRIFANRRLPFGSSLILWAQKSAFHDVPIDSQT